MAKIQNTSKQMEGYDNVLAELVSLLKSARKTAARSINTVLTATYWEVGRRIIEYEQGGKGRAVYGERLLERLSADLGRKFGRGFGIINLRQMRSFYLGWSSPQIRQTLSDESIALAMANGRPLSGKMQTPSAQSSKSSLAGRFPLPWSHYVTLLSVKSPEARKFYEEESSASGTNGTALT